MYENIAEFVKRGASLHSIEPLNDLDGRVPASCLQALQLEVDSRRSDMYKLTKQDAISKRVTDLESDWRREQLKRVVDLIGDIPRYSIGTELRGENDETNEPGISLEKLMHDIEKLPRVGMASSESNPDMEEKDVRILNEYDSLRRELVLKSQAIKLGETKVKSSEVQLTKIRHLLDSIKESVDTDSDISDYFTAYNEKLRSNLEELTYLLEESIKNADTSIERQVELQKLAKMLSL